MVAIRAVVRTATLHSPTPPLDCYRARDVVRSIPHPALGAVGSLALRIPSRLYSSC